LGSADRTIEVNNPDTGGGHQGLLSGAISGSGGIIKNGPGRLRLNGSCTYSGTTTVNEGFFAYFTDHQATGNYVVNGGTRCFCGKSPDKITGLKVTGGGVEGLAASVLHSDTTYDIQGGELYGIELSNGKDGLGNPIVTGLTKTGNTLAKLKSPCTYTGPTTISEGTLELTTFTYKDKLYTGQISVSSPIRCDGDAIFLLDGSIPHTVSTISGTGTTWVNSGAKLIATSIEQGTLIIGGTYDGLNVASSSGGGSTASVPEPGTAILLAMTGLSLLLAVGCGKRRRS
jgi:fibronectin-binding autotransporter adhesin